MTPLKVSLELTPPVTKGGELNVADRSEESMEDKVEDMAKDIKQIYKKMMERTLTTLAKYYG